MSNTKRVKKVYTVEDTKKARKRLLIIVSAVLALIFIMGIVFGFINRPGLNFLADYESVKIETHSEARTIIKTTTDTDDTRDQFNANNIFNQGLKKTRYSFLRMLLEGSFSKNFKFETKEETYTDDNGKEKTRDVRVELKGSEITAHQHTDDSEFTLTFSYKRENDKPVKSIEVEGETIYFDKAVVTVTTDGNNTIESFKIRFYDSELIGVDSVESYNYSVTPVIVKARTYKFMQSLQDVLDYFKQ